VLEGVDTPTAKVLISLDGRRSEAEVLAAAAAAGVSATTVAELLAQLRDSGFVVEGETATIAELGSPDTAERLEPDCVALSLAHPERGAVSTVRRRRGRLVVLHGGGRLGAPVGALLAAAGIGRLAVVDHERSRPCDAGPAGIAAADTFEPRAEAVARAIRRAAPEAAVGPLRPDQRPDLAILAGVEPVSLELRDALHRLCVPYLPVTIRESTAVVGPLVLPGGSTCLTCIDLSRRDHDPAWPLLLTQLSVPRRQCEPADVVLCTMAASLAAMQALELLDGDWPATVGSTLEVRPPDPAVRRRDWLAHPACECGAADSDTRRLAS
jgi:bacteriocin biosynthesis cyclodehydratase domain-containing protein